MQAHESTAIRPRYAYSPSPPREPRTLHDKPNGRRAVRVEADVEGEGFMSSDE
jgi:hypothetical protein